MQLLTVQTHVCSPPSVLGTDSIPFLETLTSPAFACAGHLYASNDYEKATELARELILDEKKRKAMAAAARAHVEKLGWMAAVKRIRDTQYQRAINTFRAHKRCVHCERALSSSIPCLHPLITQAHRSNQPGKQPMCSGLALVAFDGQILKQGCY